MPAPAQPLVRGFMCKTMLEHTQRLSAEQRRRVLALIPPGVLTRIETSPRLGWIPHEESLQVLDATRQVLGDPHFRRHLTQMSEGIMAHPMIHSFFDGAIRLFGLTPQALLKWTPQAWQQVFRDSGELVYRPVRETTVGGRAEVELEHCPPALLRSGSFVEVIAGSFEVFLRRAAKRGRVEVLLLDKEGGRVRYGISWE